MRELLLLGICMLWASAGIAKAPFAIDKDIESETFSLWNTLLKGETVFVDLDTRNMPDDRLEEYKTSIRSGIDSWFTDTARIIKESGRAEEFADILPILERGIKVSFESTWVGSKQIRPIDVFVFVKRDIEVLRLSCHHYLALACANPLPRPGIDILSLEAAEQEDMDWEGIFVHEFGHLLGLEDQYPSGVKKDRVLPESDSSSIYPEDTVMYDAINFIGCDDVDGIINLIDLRRGGAQGRRKGVAWKSFCERSNDYFKDGKRI